MTKKSHSTSTKQPQRDNKEMLLALYALLRGIEPRDDRLDVIWNGPFWVEKKGIWRPTFFLLYRGLLRGQIQLSHGAAMMEGDIRSGEVKWVDDIDMPGWPKGTDYWPKALPQLLKQLRTAVADLDEYNRRVERDMPLACRTGKVMRHLTWPKGTERMPEEQLAAIRAAAESAQKRPPLPALSTAEYLRIAEIGYDAAYPAERRASPADKHRRHADGRHGGMLDLPPDDAAAFKQWFSSRRWQGAHPFEIVYGNPHGIVLWPELENGGWRLRLSVSDEYYQKDALEMLVSLDKAGIPIDFSQTDRLLRTMEGTDDVEVGPYRDQIPLEELKKDRPDAIPHIRWDPLPKLAPVTPDGLARIVWVEEHGSMAGFKEDD